MGINMMGGERSGRICILNRAPLIKEVRQARRRRSGNPLKGAKNRRRYHETKYSQLSSRRLITERKGTVAMIDVEIRDSQL